MNYELIAFVTVFGAFPVLSFLNDYILTKNQSIDDCYNIIPAYMELNRIKRIKNHK